MQTNDTRGTIDARTVIKNDSLLTRPPEQLVADLAPAQARELALGALRYGQAEREQALRSFPERLMPGS